MIEHYKSKSKHQDICGCK